MKIFDVEVCAPAVIYLVFSLTQFILDLIKGYYNMAMMKLIVMVCIGTLLNLLCKAGLDIISWIIVFIPFILMSVIVAVLLYAMGLKETTGKLPPVSPTTPSTHVLDNSIVIKYIPPYYHGISNEPIPFYTLYPDVDRNKNN